VRYNDLLFFFFQAEDGIRDGHVTGVQTCALPIWQSLQGLLTGLEIAPVLDRVGPLLVALAFLQAQLLQALLVTRWVGLKFRQLRSEERRVGKEFRFPSSVRHYNIKLHEGR